MNIGQLLILIGILLITAGIIWLLLSHFKFPTLPGDILIKRDNFTLFIPITTSILISIVLSILIWLFKR